MKRKYQQNNEPKLKEVILSLTSRCNLKCRMCDIPLLKSEELDTLLWKRVIQEAALIGADTVVFSGGEPLLRKDIFELIAFAGENSMRSCLTSNGTLIDKDIAVLLSKAGVAVVNISIEGPLEVHDYLRGKGAYAMAVEGLRFLRGENIECTIATMVSANNYRSLPEIVELAHQLGVTTIKFQPFNKLFLNEAKTSDNFFLTAKNEKELEGLMSQVMSLCCKYGIATNPGSYLKEIAQYLCRGQTRRKKGCLALYVSCPVNAQGEIYPCWVLSGKDNMLGSLRNSSLADILNSSRRKELIRKITHFGCQGCIMSCYDDNFGARAFGERLLVKVNKSLKQIQQRIAFYSSYKGSSSSLLRKARGYFAKRNTEDALADDSGIYKKAKEDISLVKKILKKELES